ncbi:erythroblast NAD(P)(+)--arginine ADP-ribosyltransferase-like [Platichthys flesus]|uniref:erythroblast NAD(P)(+)--arginine ADP-ribosyltransferase-like n=1 Tax=Platichthys flesus TaxID=8260 RepID=UPI002DB922BC|nr:erythroblast NAD(P)(+)--arginine ADP-ribosyltransferase-like [Platichthys flesus]
MARQMLISVPLCLLLCWMLPVGSKTIRNVASRDAIQSIPLNLAKDSVDDMFLGCNVRMAKFVNNKYFKKENNGTFADVWKKSNNCSIEKFQNKDKKDVALTKNHTQAICAFTSNFLEFYQTFNAAVRTSKKQYGTSFPFHFLHFWLTSAVQILNENTDCKTTYRRTKDVFSGKVGQIIRLGSFSSSSAKPNQTEFGNKTCFEINTCLGAPLKNYSTFPNEEEVLIPPYERFKIIKIIKTKLPENLSDCKSVYILESEGVLSNLNCKETRKPRWSRVSII